jgi:hypothetical protein
MFQKSNSKNEVLKELNYNTNMYACYTSNNFAIIGASTGKTIRSTFLTTFYHYLSLVTTSGGLMVDAMKKFLS